MALKITLSSPEVNPQEKSEIHNSNSSLNKISLRGYQLHDNIILTNYENITQLEVSGNNIEYLDLSTLKKLEVLKCKGNVLNELTLNGESLTSLTASFNGLTKITVSPGSTKLTHFDVSSNKLSELPEWLDRCHQLQTLYANNNHIEELPSHIFNNERNFFHKLQLANNKLKALPNMSNRGIPLKELCLQCNHLIKLPDNIFSVCTELKVLNISNNNLESLPQFDEGFWQLEQLFATKNNFNDEILDKIINLRKLKIIHMAYNNLTSLPSSGISNWSELEELVISGNKLESLPENVSSLKKLKVLRIHSNQLQSIPDLSKMSTLRVIDLAHNKLSKINLVAVLPTNVQFLDLSCNRQLQVDSSQLKNCQSQRKISFVDVSGKNRFSLPTSTAFESTAHSYAPWQVGFSETSGKCPKLYISQLRLSNFSNTDGLFGMFNGESRNKSLSLLPKIIPTILLQQRSVRETGAEYMKYTLISAYKNLKQSDQSFGECAILCHIAKEKQCCDMPVKALRSRKYILRAAMVGGTIAYLIRKQGPVHLPPNVSKKEDDNDGRSINDADTFEISLSNDDEYLVIGSKRIWETVRIETVVQEIRSEDNVVLAAKRIQDVAQSFGAEENLSIIIVKFQNVETYVDMLIHELRQNVRRKAEINNCPEYCNDRHRLGSKFSTNGDRPSPIGQTDQEISELSVCLKRIKSDTYCIAESGTSPSKMESFEEDSLSRSCRTVEEESELNINETDSVLSEEQYKCWEYMLEQNTQLLFDKQLDKMTTSFAKNKSSASSINLNETNSTSTLSPLQSESKKKISSSFPQLDTKEYPAYQKDEFASPKNFATGRLHQQLAAIKGSNMNSANRKYSAVGGANVGYFGSLQHLMPYNFEDDFAVMHERYVGDESMEYANRMSQYWGVATTEL